MKILLLLPVIDNPRLEDVSATIHEAVRHSNHEIVYLDKLRKEEPFDKLIDVFREEIEKVDLVIVDISIENLNIMFEFGMAKSLGKPILVIAMKGTRIPYIILADQPMIFYDSTNSLFMELIHYLQGINVDDFIKEYTAKTLNKTMIFISYSHVDTEYLERLKIHLKPFEKKGLIDVWSDTKIKAGEKWKEQIENALEKSVAAILLISADFLASDFIVDNELPPLLKSAAEKGKLILPVVIKPCRFTKDENLSKFQAVNNPVIPLSKMDENGKEEVYVKIADYIEDLVR